MSDIKKRLRSFIDWHQDLWHEKGIGTAHAAMRDALGYIEELEAAIKASTIESVPPEHYEVIMSLIREEAK